jgi:hypothetical protein
MPFTTSHCESGEGAKGVKAAVDRTLDWLKTAEPGNARHSDQPAPRRRRRKDDDEVRPSELRDEDDA